MRFTWLGQAGFLLEDGETRCLLDPFLSADPSRLTEPVIAPDAIPRLAAAFVSHEHPDHLDVGTLRRLCGAQRELRVVLPAPTVGQAAGAGLPAERLLGAVPAGWTDVGGVRFHPVPALHGATMEDAYWFGPDGPSRPRFLGYVVEIGGRRVYHAGDTLAWEGLADELRRLDVEIAFLPINGRDAAREAEGIVGNMDAAEAVELAAAAGCRVLVPMHFGMFAGNTADPSVVGATVERLGLALTVVAPTLGEPLGL